MIERSIVVRKEKPGAVRMLTFFARPNDVERETKLLLR